MGRGRQKAKQRKVARTLKYSSPETDYRALERELVSRSSSDDTDESDDEFIDYYADDVDDVESDDMI